MTERSKSISYSSRDFFYDDQRIPGDVEVYNFKQPRRSIVSIFHSIQYSKPKIDSNNSLPNLVEITNEKAFSTLIATHASKSDPIEKRKSFMKGKTSFNQVKVLNEILSRIARHNNTRKYEERVGFASTLTTKAEEIGILNTVKFLLKAMNEYLVYILNINR